MGREGTEGMEGRERMGVGCAEDGAVHVEGGVRGRVTKRVMGRRRLQGLRGRTAGNGWTELWKRGWEEVGVERCMGRQEEDDKVVNVEDVVANVV